MPHLFPLPRRLLPYFIILTFTFGSLLAEDPWGPDAKLAHFNPDASSCTPRANRPGNRLAETIINFHQKVISPADGPRSHFYPSSSQYMRLAIRKHGAFNGYLMGMDRLLRENPEEWVYRSWLLPNGDSIKYDPVR